MTLIYLVMSRSPLALNLVEQLKILVGNTQFCPLFYNLAENCTFCKKGGNIACCPLKLISALDAEFNLEYDSTIKLDLIQ